jgi:hypothetical protein
MACKWEADPSTYSNGLEVKLFGRFCKVGPGLCFLSSLGEGFETITDLMLHGF